jgi:Zn-dependent metalloprotease
MDQYNNTTGDHGGVHINSGIPNKAFYEVAMELGGNAWEKAGKIWYITLKDKLNATSDFQAAADATVETAGELYGAGSTEQEAVINGWQKVGIEVVLETEPVPDPEPKPEDDLDKKKGCLNVFGILYLFNL